jgi:hypothetical protein
MDAFNYPNRLLHQSYTESLGSPVLLCSSPDNQIIDHYYPEDYQPMFNTCQSPMYQPMQPMLSAQHEPYSGRCTPTLPTQHEPYSGSCTPTWPESYPYQPVFMDYTNFNVVRSSPSLMPSIEHTSLSRPVSRAPSFRSDTSSSWMSCPRSEPSRSSSPNAGEMSKYGAPSEDGTWRCAYPGCTSKSVFRRGCDLRKHYRRHTKTLFCRHIGCRSASEGGFSSEKDRARHEAKHDPKIVCEWDGCSRVFSRVDNMVSSTTRRVSYLQVLIIHAERSCTPHSPPQARQMSGAKLTSSRITIRSGRLNVYIGERVSMRDKKEQAVGVSVYIKY